MLTSDEMIKRQAEGHWLIDAADERSVEDFVLQLMHAAAYTHIAELARGRAVLDLGCNTGWGTKLLSQTARSIVGVDVSDQAVEAARRQHAGVEFRKVDGETLPFADGSIDLIVSCQVIEHVVDVPGFLRELKRTLVPGGLVVFTTPNRLWRLDPGMQPWNAFHVREYDPAGLESALNPHFASVWLQGEFGAPALEAVEKKRVGWRRDKTRLKTALTSAPWRADLLIRKALLSLRRDLSKKFGATVAAYRNRYTIKDFHYRQDGLDGALDLLAVCGDDPARVDEARAVLARSPVGQR